MKNKNLASVVGGLIAMLILVPLVAIVVGGLVWLVVQVWGAIL